MKDLIVPIIAVGWIFVGGWHLLLALKDLFKVKKAKDWIKAKGIINESSLESFTSDEGNILYEAKVKYTYGKARNEGTRIYFGYDASNIKKHHLKLINQFGSGKVVDVYYNPINSSDSVLIRSLRPYLLFKLFISLLFFVPGLLLGAGYLIYRLC